MFEILDNINIDRFILVLLFLTDLQSLYLELYFLEIVDIFVFFQSLVIFIYF